MSIQPEDLTIVLPTRNEDHNVRSFLDSIPSHVMLIVVDASEDSTSDVVAALRPERTRVLRHSGMVAEARQIGADAARTPWLLFTDADVVFSQSYFSRLTGYGGCDMLYGPKLSADHFVHYYRWFSRGQHLLHLLGVRLEPAGKARHVKSGRRLRPQTDLQRRLRTRVEGQA